MEVSMDVIRAEGDERLGPIHEAVMSEAQRVAAQELCATPRASVFGPFTVMLRSPEVLNHAQRLGNYLRFNSILPVKLREMAMLIAGRHWQQPFVWYVHEPVARQKGVSDEIVRGIAEARRPSTMTTEETEIYDFCTELFASKRVSDASYDPVLQRFGEQGVVELVAVMGYFGLLAMMMDVARTPLPDDGGFVTPFVLTKAERRT
jgi:4-carboxymuconolactone decarboxylase